MINQVFRAFLFAFVVGQITLPNIAMSDSVDPVLDDGYYEPGQGDLIDPNDDDLDGVPNWEDTDHGKPVTIPPPTPTPTPTPTPSPTPVPKPEKHDDWCPGLECLICTDCLGGVLHIWGEFFDFDGIWRLPSFSK